MQIFNYRARDQKGGKLQGRIEARSPSEAARVLRERGLVVVSLSPVVAFFLLDILKNFRSRVGLADIAIFTRQFATMVNAGLPLTDALQIIRSQSKAALAPTVNEILVDVQGGTSLADALNKHQVFSQVYIALVRAGETGGVLDKILARLAETLEKQREFQSKVKGALIYPIIVVVTMIAVMIFMMIFVVPKLTSIYKDFNVELPVPTKILIAISSGLISFWWLIPIFLISGLYGLRLYGKTEKGRVKLDSLRLRVPILGAMDRQVIITEFGRTLGLLVGAGIPILEALKVVSGVVGNKVYTLAINRASERVEKGFSLSYALAQESEIFPPMLYQMLAVGEETGKVDETLLSVSHVFEQESEYSVRNLTAAIEPIIMIILGLSVGLLVVSIILPIFNLTQQF